MHELLEGCLVEELREPVKFIDVLPDESQRTQSFSNSQELNLFLGGDANRYTCRCISICQRNSWQPLQVTRSMLDMIVQNHGLGPSFWDLPSCFYARTEKLEQGYSMPYTVHKNGPWTEISYTVRYPEAKHTEEGLEWTIRQTGIYQRFNSDTHESINIIFNPVPNAKLQSIAERLLQNRKVKAEKYLYWLHDALFSSYIPSWRRYIRYQEEQFLPIANTAFATYIDEPLRVGYDNLNTVVSLESKLIQALALLGSTTEVLNDLVTSLTDELKDQSSQPHMTGHSVNLKNYRRQCIAYATTATYLQQRTENTAQLLANTLSFRDQVIAKQQNSNMLQLNKSAVFITTITLVYVPASFVATFFGMNFFAMDQDHSRIVGTTMIWIYIVATVALTFISVMFYYWLVQHDGLLFKRLAPKVQLADWRNLRFSLRRKGTAISDIRHLAV